jgi:HEAT repeat protein
LKDESAAVRICVAYGLADIGPDAIAAEEALVESLSKDADAKVRTGAAYALGTIKPKSTSARAALRKAAMNDPDQVVREEAARSWDIIGASGKTPKKSPGRR